MARVFDESLWSQREAINVSFDLPTKQPHTNHSPPSAGFFIALEPSAGRGSPDQR